MTSLRIRKGIFDVLLCRVAEISIFRLFLLFAFCFPVFKGFSQTVTEQYSAPGTYTITVPAGVTSMTVRVWGPGGGGADRSPNDSEGGGGGGAGGFRGGDITVSAGNSVTIIVGTGGNSPANNPGGTGGNSSFTHSSGSITATGGGGGARTNGGGAGGAAGGGSFSGTVSNQIVFASGTGGAGDINEGGGGGGSAGSTGNGGNGANITAGTAGAGGGASGGAGGDDGGGVNGNAPGGGGGGAGDDADNSGGDGGNGQVIITYSLPASPRTYYSRQDGNWNATTTWALSGHTGGVSTGLPLPGSTDIILIGGQDDVTIPQNYSAGAASVTISDDATTSCNLFVGDGTGTNAAATLTIGGDITLNNNSVVRVGGTSNTASRTSSLSAVNMTLNGTSTFTLGNDGNVTNTVTISGDLTVNASTTANGGGNGGSTNILNLGGNLINSGTINYTSTTDTQTLNFTGNGSLTGTATLANFYNLTVSSGTRTFGENSNVRTINVNNNFSISSGATFESGNTGSQVHTINLTGTLTNDGTLDFTVNNPTSQLLTFNGGTAQSINGAGIFNLSSLVLSKSGSNVTVNATSNITIGSTLDFSNSCILVVGANSNIVLSSSPAYATITGAANDRYIQLDGSTGINSNLIVPSDGTAGRWQLAFPVGTATGGYSPVTIPTVTTAPDVNSTLAVKAIYTTGQSGLLRRTFRFTITGNDNGTTFSNAVFNYYDADVFPGDTETDYTTAWKSESGSLITVASSINTVSNTFTVNGGTLATATLNTGTYLYTIGRPASRVWYSYQTGNYNDFNTWTLDPSGTTFDNGLNLFPSNGDEIHILNGFTVTVNLNTRTLNATEMQGGGILNLGTTTGHNLGTITGTGLLRIQGVSLPAGTYTDFVAATGGTIEYYNTGGTLSSTQTTYNELRMTNSTGANIIYTLASNMTVNGMFELSTTGAGTVTWQINGNGGGNNVQRTITLYDDLNVASGGRITAGTGNPTNAHNLTMFGDFTNNGIVQFGDPTNVPFNSSPTSSAVLTAALTGRAVNVIFSGTADQIVTCESQTDFYRFIVDKGSTQQPMVTVNSSAASNLRLFGPTDLSSTNSGSPNGAGYSNCALSIINGTLQLIGTLAIPTLIEKGLAAGQDFFTIPQTGALWLNSPDVSVTLTSNVTGNNDDERLLVNGLFKVSNGSTFNGGHSRGIGAGTGGSTTIEGANTTVTIAQYRPIFGGSGIIAYSQTGGTLNVGTTGYNGTPNTTPLVDDGATGITSQYARFSLGNVNSSFQMSDGIINIGSPTSAATGGGALAGGLDIQSTPGNYNVTGGTINMYIPQAATVSPASGSSDFTIYSTAPLYNLNIYRVGTTGGTHTAVLNSALTILNNLTIVTGNTPTLSCSGNNLTIGGNFEIQNNTTFTPGANIITLNGSSAQAWTHNGTITSLGGSVILNKSAGTLTLGGSQTFPDIANLTLTAGTLNDGGKILTVTSTLSNSAVHAGTGHISSNGPATISGNNGTFGTLRIQSNSTVVVSGNQTVTGNLRLTNTNSSLNIGSNNLTVSGIIYSDNAETQQTFSANKRIITSGLHNAGGLTRQGVAGNLLFPVGTGTLYTPSTINVTATTHGTITVRPVSSEHPNATTPNESLHYYWRVTSSGYVNITDVTHSVYTHNNPNTDVLLAGGNTGTYRVARFDPSNFTWATSNGTFDASALTAIPDFNTNVTWTGVAGSRLDGEYTCGFQTAFGAVTPYYSKNNGSWNAGTGVWTSNPDHATGSIAGPPCSYCPVIIGDGASINHKIDLVANGDSCGTLSLNSGSTLDCGIFTGLDLGTNTTGRGTLRIAAATAGTGVFPRGDFLNFLGTAGGTVEWYGTTKTIPNTFTGPDGSTQNLNIYYNLVINPSNANTITLPAINLTVYNNWVQGSSPFGTYDGTVLTNGLRTISIIGNLNVESGTFNFAETPTNSPTTLNLTGNLVNNGTFSIAATTANNRTNTHAITISGGVTNNGTMNLRQFTSGTRYNVANFIFTGTSNVNFNGSGSGGTTFNLVTVNKGTSQIPEVTFSTGGTVTATAVAAGWLILQNGTFNFANTATVSTDLSTSSYTIPSTAKLKVSGTNVTVNTTNTLADANDLFLSGALEVTGGTLNVGSTAGTTNNVDIEYSAAGNPTIIVSNTGILWVRSSIRRSTAVLTGALVYDQSGGTVTVGGIASNNTRGVFEIDNNAGSSFNLTGTTSALNVQRQTGGTGLTDVYIDPVTSSVSPTSTITLGLGSVNTNTNFRVNIVPAIGNFTVAGGANAQTVMLYRDLVLGGNLTITSPSILNATNPNPDANVTIAGNFDCTGTYTSGTNTTTFNGAGAQSAVLTSTTDFYNVTLNKPSGILTVSGTAPAAPGLNNLSILSGTLEVGTVGTPLSSTLKVNRDIIINGQQTGAQAVEVYSTTGISNTITSSGGSFTSLTLGGSDATARTVDVSGNLIIDGVLTFNPNRYLMIGSHALAFGVSATVSGAGSTAFVKTNGVSSDLGVIKNWASSGSFTYPVGTAINYTPVSFGLNVTQTGTLTVVPVNSAHLTYNQGSAEQILNYYWSVRRGASLNATASGNFTFSYLSSMITGSGGTLVAGYLNPNSNPLGWTTSAHGGTATTTQMTFASTPTTNLPAAGAYYDYTVGTINTLPNPILPLYSRVTGTNVTNLGVGGDWTTASNWTVDTDGDPDGNNPSSIIPNGVPAVILSNARINTTSNGRRVFKITINGLLSNGSTTGHNFGTIDGTGTFRTATNTFPAGDYTSFVSSSGGTVEYIAPMTMNSMATYNNLSIYSGSAGSVAMTASNLTINGNVTIPVGTTLDNSVNNASMSIARNWINNGTFNPGTGAASVSFNGSVAQSTTGSTTFNILEVNKTNDLTLGATTTVNGGIVMTAGNIISNTFPAAPLLVLGSAVSLSGGSASSFVSGQIRKTINTGSSFTFPVGSNSASRYRPVGISNASATDTWNISYIPNNPTTDGFPNASFNSANLVKVSQYEYWQVANGLGTTTASMTLSFGPGSYGATGDVGNLSQLRTARWNGSQWDLPPGGGSFTPGGSITAGTITVSVQSSFSPQTLASLDINSALPIGLVSFRGQVAGDAVQLIWETASELNNDFFTVERLNDKDEFDALFSVPGKGTSTKMNHYETIDFSPLAGKNYYRLKQTDFDGQFTYSRIVVVDFTGMKEPIKVYPNPSKNEEITIEIKQLNPGQQVSMEIQSLIGVRMFSSTLNADSWGSIRVKVPTAQWPAGMYLMNTGSASGVQRKIIIE